MPRARSRRPVGAAAVVERTEVEQHRALRHLGRDRLVVRSGRSLSSHWWLPGITRVAPFSSVKSLIAHIVWHSTSKPVGNGKKSNAHWSRCTSCAGSPGTDLDHLGEVQLVARRVVAEHAVERAEHERMRGEIAEARRPREQRAGAARVVTGELVGAGRGRAQVRLELRLDAIELLGRREPLHHHATVLAQRGLHRVDATRRHRAGELSFTASFSPITSARHSARALNSGTWWSGCRPGRSACTDRGWRRRRSGRRSSGSCRAPTA